MPLASWLGLQLGVCQSPSSTPSKTLGPVKARPGQSSPLQSAAQQAPSPPRTFDALTSCLGLTPPQHLLLSTVAASLSRPPALSPDPLQQLSPNPIAPLPLPLSQELNHDDFDALATSCPMLQELSLEDIPVSGEPFGPLADLPNLTNLRMVEVLAFGDVAAVISSCRPLTALTCLELCSTYMAQWWCGVFYSCNSMTATTRGKRMMRMRTNGRRPRRRKRRSRRTQAPVLLQVPVAAAAAGNGAHPMRLRSPASCHGWSRSPTFAT